jgi:response regulator RpfG family c-di-GMP phosphodiesterase/serine/threonine protein kinase
MSLSMSEQSSKALDWANNGPANNSAATVAPAMPLRPAVHAFLDHLLKLQLLSASFSERFLRHSGSQIGDIENEEQLCRALVQAGLLTEYQLDRVMVGTTHGLVFGNHRVLNRLGSGSMGVIFLAEHMLMKRQVAVKVVPVDEDCPSSVLERFYSEVRVLADLHHPNIVAAIDAGKLPPASKGMPALLYLVMELVRGGDLEEHVQTNGPVEIPQACEWIRQAACGLQEAHDRHLIHRDVKPSNLLLDEQNQVKLVDFGLVRQFCSQLTDHRSLLGTPDFMAPEQAGDPSTVDGRADIYGLGATLFWLLTGQMPYKRARSVAEALQMLQSGKPRHLREVRADIPAQLDAIVDSMLARDPDQRPNQPLAVMSALLPFAQYCSLPTRLNARSHKTPDVLPAAPAEAEDPLAPVAKVLIVDDELAIRYIARQILEAHGFACSEAVDGVSAIEAFSRDEPDLILLDIQLPGITGYEVCQTLRKRFPQRQFKIIIVSGQGDRNDLAEALDRGADDYIVKPLGIRELPARVMHALRLKEAQDQTAFLSQQLQLTNRQLQSSLAARTSEVRKAHDALLVGMAKMAEAGDGETPGHLQRMQRYTRLLAENVQNSPSWEGVINRVFLEQLERCVPLHDIGKIGLPEHILLKPGKLTPEERGLMETHTLIGDRMLEAIRHEYGHSLQFLGIASSIVRSHHERFDGAGYPDRLSGEAIHAAARLTAVADVYDALRRQRAHKTALSHADTVRVITQQSGGQFDPDLVTAFQRCAGDFEQIFKDIPY